jgi:hypothetical protein
MPGNVSSSSYASTPQQHVTDNFSSSNFQCYFNKNDCFPSAGLVGFDPHLQGMFTSSNSCFVAFNVPG